MFKPSSMKLLSPIPNISIVLLALFELIRSIVKCIIVPFLHHGFQG